MQINLNISKKLFVPKFYPFLTDYSSRWECFLGGAGSAKSYFITQKLIVRAIREQIRILVCRRYASTLRNTCFSLFKDILTKWQLTPYVKINESDYRIRFPNGSEIIFLGLDDETKLLSLNNIGTIFIEEAYEVPQNLVEQLNLRMRGKNINQQILMAWNPISKNHWLYKFCENPPESFILHHSTYKDNPFLSKEYVQALEELRVRNPQRAKVFCDGEWGVDTEGLVITNWRIEDFNEYDLQGYEHRCGMDLGWVDKTAIVSSFYKDKKIYVSNEFYKSGCQLDDIVTAIQNLQLGKSKIYVDSAEPRSIQFFRNNRINAVPSKKGQNSVKSGLMFLQNNEIIVHPRCKNLIMELENFSYIRSKLTGEWTEDTTHEWSHAIDALRYAYSDIYQSNRMQVIDKSVLGL